MFWANSYVCKSYSLKTGKGGVSLVHPFWIGLMVYSLLEKNEEKTFCVLLLSVFEKVTQ